MSPADKKPTTLDVLELHKEWMKDPEYRKEYEALEEEFAAQHLSLAAKPAAVADRTGTQPPRAEDEWPTGQP